jgi:hypothetical protein
MAKLPIPPWVKYARWAYKAGDWLGEFLHDISELLLVEVTVEMFTDSLIAEDAMECTVYFTIDELPLEENVYFTSIQLDSIAQDVGEAFEPWGAGGQLRVTSRILTRDSEPPEAGAAIGRWEAHAGVVAASLCPREVALCLSYFGGRNLPGMRGRIFLPVAYTGTWAGVRPTSTLAGAALELADRLAAVGSGGTDWSVYSRTQGLAFSITDSWVDDEWDTQRSRGLRSTTRVSATHDEA